ncbi:MAG: hypothetical protein KC619_09715 [Myxococcales bacterium]|nr:hypothetical protein [Myxococcales bacterium]
MARTFVRFAIALLLSACSSASPADAGSGLDGSTTTDGGGADGGGAHEPAMHRSAAVECSHDRGPGTADPGIPDGPCTTDADCADDPANNPRCLASTLGARSNYCSSDACFVDGDCPGGRVCHCREQPSDPNDCTPDGNCVVDADCGEGGWCSPSRGHDRINVGVFGYFCHTPDDECIDDADCGSSPAEARCVWFPDRSHWACSSEMFLPP